MTQPSSQPSREVLAAALPEIAIAAGREILSIYHSDFEVKQKDDASPVTAADEAAEQLITARLLALAPTIPVIAEEAVAAGNIPEIGDGPFWLVDPLDGTKEFISRNGEFTVNIALIEDGRPVLGAVHLPALGESFWTVPDGGAWRSRDGGEAEPIRCRERPERLAVVASRSHRDSATDDYLARYEVSELISAGSSLKFCRVAEGAADLYPRLGRTMEWDTAAGHAVLLAAGGSVLTMDDAPLRYRKPGFENPHFVARGW